MKFLTLRHVGYSFIALSVICLVSHLYLLIAPYSYITHVPSFCVLGILMLFGMHWQKSKFADFPPLSDIFKFGNINPTEYSFLTKTLLLYVFIYFGGNVIAATLLDKKSIINEGAMTGAFLFVWCYGIGHYYLRYRNES